MNATTAASFYAEASAKAAEASAKAAEASAKAAEASAAVAALPVEAARRALFLAEAALAAAPKAGRPLPKGGRPALEAAEAAEASAHADAMAAWADAAFAAWWERLWTHAEAWVQGGCRLSEPGRLGPLGPWVPIPSKPTASAWAGRLALAVAVEDARDALAAAEAAERGAAKAAATRIRNRAAAAAAASAAAAATAYAAEADAVALRARLLKEWGVRGALGLRTGSRDAVSVAFGDVGYRESRNGDKFWSPRKGWRGSEWTVHEVVVDETYQTVHDDGLAYLDGMPTLSARRLDGPADTAVYAAVWLEQGRGSSWTLVRGTIAVAKAVAGVAYHAEGDRDGAKAVAGVRRKVRAADPAVRAEREAADARRAAEVRRLEERVIAFPDVVVSRDDARTAGACVPGIRSWCHTVGLGDRETATVAEVVQGYKIQPDRYARLACVAAIRRAVPPRQREAALHAFAAATP